jgi:hypothetical protein
MSGIRSADVRQIFVNKSTSEKELESRKVSLLSAAAHTPVFPEVDSRMNTGGGELFLSE